MQTVAQNPTQVIPPKANGHDEPAALVPNITPLDLLRMAVAQDLDVDKFAQLIDLHIKWQANEARKAFASAMHAFKAEAPKIVANAIAKFPKKDDPSVIIEWDYASLDHVCNELVPCMSRHGLSHSWKTEMPEKAWIRVTCVLLHAQGHREAEAVLEGAPDTTGSKNAIQAIGSTAAYLERYTLLAAAGIAVKGMDKSAGNAAGGSVATSSGVAIDTVKANCDRLAAATSREQLTQIFKEVYSQASQAKDSRAQQSYIDAQKARQKAVR